MRVLHGALFGINGTANMALATEFIPDDHMGEGLGYYGLGQVLAQIVGPTIGLRSGMPSDTELYSLS